MVAKRYNYCRCITCGGNKNEQNHYLSKIHQDVENERDKKFKEWLEREDVKMKFREIMEKNSK